MSNFSSLDELLNTTAGMTVLRNNSGQDDGVDTVTGVDWFTFNGVVASKIYVSGNSFVGFGSNAEHLKICSRDGKMWYLYRQEGAIGAIRFLKIRWQGYTRYNFTSTDVALIWELFLFDDNGFYVNIVTVPTASSYLGTSQLVCGSKTYNFSIAAGNPTQYSFICDESGTFTISNEPYPVLVNHVSYGSIEFSTEFIRQIDSVVGSKIFWESELPEGTTIKVSSKLSSGNYSQCTSGGSVAGIAAGADLSNETLHIKVEMSTEDITQTPTLTNLFVQLLNTGDDHILVLEFDKGNVRSIQNAVGDIDIAYAGGTLIGVGGAVAPFEMSFTPEGLLAKNNPHDAEHIEISSIQASSRLVRIYYHNVKAMEHIDISNIEAVGNLIRVDDI